MTRRLALRIDKVYGDVIAADGRFAILYLVNISIGPLTLTGRQLLTSEHTEKTRLSLRAKALLPGVDPSGAFSLDGGHWEPQCPPIEQTLGADGHRFRWACLCPSGTASIRVDGQPLAGQGYLEHLSFAVPPWGFALGELRWGRWLSDDDSLVWVASTQAGFEHIIRRGETVAPGDVRTIGDRRIEARDFSLTLCPVTTIRRAKLLDTLPELLARCLPRSITEIFEDKRVFRGSLRLRNGMDRPPTNGFAIAETVTFPQGGQER